MKGNLEQRSKIADQKNKIWQYKTGRIAFFFLVTGGVLTIWDKCVSNKPESSLVTTKSRDSANTQQPRSIPQTVSQPHKSPHRKQSPVSAGTEPNTQASTQYSDKGSNTPAEQQQVRDAYPVQVSSDDIQFKLLNAVGSKGAQTIKLTMVLTTNAANRYIWSQVNSIIDPDGNEYKLKSFTNGSSSYDPHVALNTDVPIKLTYTFGGVLPKVRYIKLFKFEYRHKSLDDNISVDFRDILVEWK